MKVKKLFYLALPLIIATSTMAKSIPCNGAAGAVRANPDSTPGGFSMVNYDLLSKTAT